MRAAAHSHAPLLRLLAILVGAALALTLGSTPAQALPTDPPTVVSLTFDDGNDDQMAAADTLDRYGMKGTFFITTGFIDNPGWLTRTQLDSLAAAGHEIGGHSVTHADLPTLSIEEATRQICQGRATLAEWGFPTRSFAYPFASRNDAVKAATQACGFNSARNLGDLDTRFGCTGCGFAESIPPADLYDTKAADQVDSTWTLADLQNTVLNAENSGGGWVQLTFHHICDSGCDPTLTTTSAIFDEFIAWLAPRQAAENTTVKTVGDVIGGAVRPIVPASTTTPMAPGPGVNGVINPSLETVGTGGLPQCWAVGGFGTNNAAFSTVTTAHTGSAAEQLTVTNLTSGDSKLIVTQDLGSCAPTVTPEHSYSLRAWYTSTVTTQFDVYLRNAVGGWRYWTSSPYFAASDSYVQAIWDTAPMPAGTTGISFGLNLIQNGTLVTDDYALYDTVGAPGLLLPATPAITGTAQVGGLLTAVPGGWTPATATLAYQWSSGGVDVAGATSVSYAPVPADLGNSITVRVTGTAPGFEPATASAGSPPTTPVFAGELAVGSPAITGVARVGVELTAVTGAWLPGTATLAFQWRSGGVDVTGATSPTFTPRPTDVGKPITVRVTGSAAGYLPATLAVTSPATPGVGAGSLATGVPTITGTATVGGALTAAPGTWSPLTTTFSYQWLRGTAKIAGATGAGYAPVAADNGAALSVRVTGTAAGYAAASVDSASVTVGSGTVTAVKPVITGVPKVGVVLRAVPGSWSPTAVSLAYQWAANGVPLRGATASAYTPVKADAGKTLTVTVTGSAPGYNSAAATSARTATVAAAAVQPTSSHWTWATVWSYFTPRSWSFRGFLSSFARSYSGWGWR